MAGFTTERWRVLSPYLDQALDLDMHEREPWLTRLRLEDAALATELEELLDEWETLNQSGFLDGTADVVPPPPSLALTRRSAQVQGRCAALLAWSSSGVRLRFSR